MAITRNRYNLQGDTCYQCLSTDEKPVENVPLNSLLLELDTGSFYYFDGTFWNLLEGSGSGGGGMSSALKTAILNCFAKVAWIDDDGQDYYDALYNALNGV